jgi:hypothetical protein
MGEFRTIDDDQHVGVRGNDRIGGLANAAQEFRQAGDDFRKADDGQIASGNRLGTPSPAICAPPTPENRAAGARRLMAAISGAASRSPDSSPATTNT